MFDRQLLHRLVQFFLKFFYKELPIAAIFISQLLKDFSICILFVEFLKAEEGAQAGFAQMGERGIDRDAVEPGKE